MIIFFNISLGFSQEREELLGKITNDSIGETFINIVNIETNFSDENMSTAIVNLRFTLNVDVTSEENLTLDFSNYNIG